MTVVGRRRPGHLPLPRRLAEEPRRLPARVPGRRAGAARAQLPQRAAHPGGGRAPWWRPSPERIEKKLKGVERRARALLALPLRARPGPGRGRRGRAADRAPACAPERDLRAGALGQERGRGAGLGARGARGAGPHLRRGRLLPARRGARRAGLAARPGRPERLGRGGARAQPAAGRAALGRRGAPHPARPPAQARHAVGRGGGARGPAALRGGPRPRAGLPAPLPLGLRPRSRTAAPTPSCCA